MKRKIKRTAMYEEPVAEVYCEDCEREFKVIAEFDDQLTCPYCGSITLVNIDEVEFEWPKEEKKMKEKQDEYFQFLNGLRESGLVNMFGASSVLEQNFPELDKEEATKILIKWMKQFGSENI